MARSTIILEWRKRLDELVGEHRLSEQRSALVRALDRAEVETRLQALREREPATAKSTDYHVRKIDEWEQRVRRILESATPTSSLAEMTAAQKDLAKLRAEIANAPRLWLYGDMQPQSGWPSDDTWTYVGGMYGTGEGSRRDD
jgi:histidyl-tRNA synthetase